MIFLALSARTIKPDLDGRSFWQPFKKLFEDIDLINQYGWKSLSKNLTETLAHLENETDEMCHFWFQLYNLPYNYGNITMKRLLQLALNIGQLEGSMNNAELLERPLLCYGRDFFEKEKVSSLDTFVSIEIQNRISNELILHEKKTGINIMLEMLRIFKSEQIQSLIHDNENYNNILYMIKI